MARGRRCLAACILLLDLFRVDASWAVDSGFHHAGTWASIFSIDPSRAESKSRSRLQRRAPLLRPSPASRHAIPDKIAADALLCRYRGAVGSIGRDCRRWGGVSFVVFSFVFPLSNPRSSCCSRTGIIPVSPARREGSSRRNHIQIPSQQEWPHPGSACCRPAFMARQGGRGGRWRRSGVVSMAKEGELATTADYGGSDETPLRSLAGASSSSVIGKKEEEGYVRPEIPTWKHKAVIIPGFATDSRAFEQLCHRLERRGIASVVVPIRWYHWLPTLGGRSVRPILDRIHETVIRCVAAKDHKEMPYAFNEPGLQTEVAPYTVQDFWAEMGDPKRGAHHMGPLDLPVVPATPPVDDRVMLIAHSAGGWMSRIYLSQASYDGRVYNASSLVSGLVTLGTPHVRLEDDQGRPRELPFSRNFKFVEEFCTGEKGGGWEKTTPTTCIGGAALKGHSTFGGLLKDLVRILEHNYAAVVYQSYELCCGDGTGVGDGITPLQSAFDMADAERYVKLEGVYHAAGLGGPWYGSDNVIDSWLEPSLDAIFGPPRADTDRPTTPSLKPSNTAVSGAGREGGDRGRAGGA